MNVELTLVHRADTVLGGSGEFARQVAQAELPQVGVRLVLDTEVVSIDDDSLQLKRTGSPDPYTLPADVVLWTAGSRPSSLLPSLGLPLDSDLRVTTDRFLRVSAADERPRGLFALGDAAKCDAATGSETPSTAQAAMQQADYAAWNVRASLRGEKLLPFRFQDLGEMLSLGDDSATVSSLGIIKLKGSLGSNMRRAVYAARMPTTSQAAKVGVSWATDAVLCTLRKALQPKKSNSA